MVTAVFAARVGTGVQPLQGENYTYSRVLSHVHSCSSVTSSRVVSLRFLPPSSPLPRVESVEVQGEGVPAPTSDGWEMCMEIYVYACIGNPSLSIGYFLYLCIHLKACIRMLTWTYPVLGDSLARCRIRAGVRRQQWQMVRLKLRSPCYAQVLPVEMKFEMKVWHPKFLIWINID